MPNKNRLKLNQLKKCTNFIMDISEYEVYTN